MKKLIAYSLAFCFLITQTSCFGSFELVKKIYDFNDSASDNNFVKTLLFYLMVIIPVYGISAFLDVIIFNLIEFWSGSNPLAMAEGEVEQEVITVNGQDYLVTATKNQFKFEKLNGEEAVEIGILKYKEESKTWAYAKNGEETNLATVNEDFSVTYYTNQGDYNVDRETLVGSSSNLALASK
ncbi:MAG: hypothetical protein CMP59_04635 [Flavobacteriales bacterium]|nr:hypothetical protein [Flavobacteriales bacterium]|tara:strand:- start:332 stop:877 length:546 start_codon:yes stop_codon:yes gene_type:complete